MKSPLTEAEVERAVAVAYAYFREPGGFLPHAIIEDLIGLEPYRRFMRCPDTEVLAAYAEDSLPFENALRIAAHENQCPVCRADVADLRRFVGQQVTQLLAATPAWATPFVGREELRESLAASLASGNRRALTLASPSGGGKTRLLLETAVEQSHLFPDGVWYIPAAGIDNPARLAGEIARAAQLSLPPRAAPEAVLREFFADKRALLVLDDMIAHSPAARLIAELIGGTSELCCLMTGTSALGLPGEQDFALPPLETPRPDTPPRELLAGESMQLFLEHARAAQPDTTFDERDTPAIASLCQRAGGMPLALELAAARAQEMSPDEMLRRIGPESPSQSPGESLHTLLAWSYNLLAPREQTLLQRLSVFADSFHAEQAAAICEIADAPEIIESLHEKAMLQRLDTSTGARYRLLSPVQSFASRHLGERAPETRRKHLAYFLHYAQERAEQLEGQGQVEAVAELSADLPNLRAGMDWAQEMGLAREAADFGVALHRFLVLQGLWQECEERLRDSVGAAQRAGDRDRQEQTRLSLARCLTRRGDNNEAETLFRSLRTEAAQRNDRNLLARSDYGLGNIAEFRGRLDEAILHIEAALSRFEATGDKRGLAYCRQSLGWIAWKQGDYARARQLLFESLTVQRERGDRYTVGLVLAYLGNIALEQNRLDEARGYFEECLRVRQELGDVRGIASAITNMGQIAQALGDTPQADYCYAWAARLLNRIGARHTLGLNLNLQGELALARGEWERARELFEASRKTLESVEDAHDIAFAVGNLGRVAEQKQSWEEAGRHYCASLRGLHAVGDQAGIGIALSRCAHWVAQQGDRERAILLLHHALTLSAARQLPHRQEIETALRALESQLGAEPAARLQRHAAALTLDEIVALALEE